MKSFIKGANPYMPLWEHVPDGEPRVFEHNGEKRVYPRFPEHNTMKSQCGHLKPIETIGNPNVYLLQNHSYVL